MPPKDLILAFDTSAAHIAAALLLGNEVLAHKTQEMHKGQAEHLFPILEDVLKEAGKDWKDLTKIAVGTGPGNFTGIRLSVSAARGLALSLDVPAIGISVLEALAYGKKGNIISAIDARRDRVYTQEFHDGCPTNAPQIEDAADLDHTNTYIGADLDFATPPTYPLAQAIALCASTKETTERPAPLYIRAPDAALPKDPPPVILP